MCPSGKISFKTEEEAKKELTRIVESNFKPWVNKKMPCRYYKCEDCGNYHLTSKHTVLKN